MKLRIVCLIVILFFSSIDIHAQYKRKSGKYSIGAGAFFLDFGYLMAGYSNSNLHLVGSGYDFTLKGVKATDIKIGGVPQFTARAGYFFTNNWAIAAGVDHMKYAIKDSVQVLLSGNINPGIDKEWSGDYLNESVYTSKNHFYYANTKGQYYIHADAIYSVYLVRTDKFAMPIFVGPGIGALVSINELNFAEKHDLATKSLSGYGINGQLGFRLEFFNHVFLQVQGDGGFMHQLKVANRPNIPAAITKQSYFYGAVKFNLGFNFYFRPKNACDSCPKW